MHTVAVKGSIDLEGLREILEHFEAHPDWVPASISYEHIPLGRGEAGC